MASIPLIDSSPSTVQLWIMGTGEPYREKPGSGSFPTWRLHTDPSEWGSAIPTPPGRSRWPNPQMSLVPEMEKQMSFHCGLVLPHSWRKVDFQTWKTHDARVLWRKHWGSEIKRGSCNNKTQCNMIQLVLKVLFHKKHINLDLHSTDKTRHSSRYPACTTSR